MPPATSAGLDAFFGVHAPVGCMLKMTGNWADDGGPRRPKLLPGVLAGRLRGRGPKGHAAGESGKPFLDFGGDAGHCRGC